MKTTTKESVPGAALRVARSAATGPPLGTRRRRRREDVIADSLLDPSGFVIGDRWVGSAPDPVLLDGSWAPDNLLVGSSMCLLGAAGTGKTQGGHRIITGTLAGGGQVVVADLQTGQEYAALAESVADLLPEVRRRIVCLDDPTVCVDPLAIFTGTGERYTHTFALCALILGAGRADPRTGPLSLMLDRVIGEVAARPETRMSDVIAALETDSQLDGVAAAAAHQLRGLAAHPLGGVIFGDGEPLTDPAAADYLVFAGRHLDLSGRCAPSGVPSQENALGQGLMYLIAVIARQVALADPARVCLCVFEQPTALTASPDTEAEVLCLLHDSRRMAVQVMFICQDGSDLEPVWAHMISYWFAFRHHTIASARRTLLSMDLAYNDELAVALISRDMSPGDCLVRDARGHTGLVRFRPAALTPAAEVAAHGQAVTGRSFLARAGSAAAGTADRVRQGAAGSWRRRDNRRGGHT